MKAPTLSYRPDIDGMRAIAVGLVVVFHFQLLPMGEAGFVGVDIFFVISGFLITRIILGGLGRGDFSLGTFYLARIRRLYPALLTVLAGTLLAGYFLFLPDLFRELSVETGLSLLYVVNIYFWRSVNYFGLQAEGVPLLHLWSLAIEEQFYLFYPLGLILLHRLARGHITAIILPVTMAILAASFALGWFATGWKPQAAFYLLPTRAWELLAGGVLAMALLRWHPPKALIAIAGPTGLALIVLTLALHGPGTPFPGWFAALPVLASIALLISGLEPRCLTSRALSARLMVWLGRISYPLYLVHWPVLIALRNTLPETDYAWRLSGLGLSVLLAWAILQFVETPIRSGRALKTARSFLVTTGTTTAGLALACLAGWQTDGLPQRFDPRVAALLAYAEDRPARYESCDWPTPECPLGPEGLPTVAVVGDSHAQALAGAFDIWLHRISQPGVLMFGSACLPVPGTGSSRCAAFAESAIARTEASPTIRTVFLVSIWRQPYGGKGLMVDGHFLHGTAAVRPAFEAALEATVTRLRAAGKTVFLVDPLYAAPHCVPITPARNLAFGTDWPVDTPLETHRRDFTLLYEAFGRAEQAGALRLSMIEELCRTGVCPGTVDETPIFADANHIRFGLSPIFADILEREIMTQGWQP